MLLLIVVAVALVGGTAAVVARGVGLWSPPGLPARVSPRRLREGLTPARPAAAPANGHEAAPVPAAPPVAPAASQPPPPEPVPTDLARLAERVERQGDLLVARLDGLSRDTATAREEAVARQAAAEARQEAALERLRAHLVTALAAHDAATAARDARLARLPLAERQADAAAELYARLARLEAAVAAVTNPILLPGEPYVPPAEFLAEALAWENWKDVGERAFAFADHFNTQRLHLSEPTRNEVAAFVTTLRGLLTRSVYPNLRPDPTPAQLQALRAALDQLAAALPPVRDRLAGEYRARVDDTAGEDPPTVA